MAISLTLHPSKSPCFSVFPFSSRPAGNPTTLALRNLHGRHSSPLKLIRETPLLFISHSSSRKGSSFVASLSVQQSAPTNGDDNNRNYPTDVKTLIRVYQEALGNGDEKVVSEIEAVFCEIEKEKNKMDNRVLTLSMEIASGKEKLIRLQADFDNTRKKSEKDRLSTQSNAKGEVMKSLLPIVDSFETAKQLMKPGTETEKKIDTSYQGIYRQFVEVLRSLRVSAIATVGKPFDPLFHEAVSREESQEIKAGTIIRELNRGFLLGDRVLRPAKVIISLGPGHKNIPSVPGETETTAA